jgi:hypothetical protein
MKLYLERDIKIPKRTLGKLHVNGIRQFYTVEDEYRQVSGVPVEEWKIKGETAIPTGIYRIVINHSNRFKKKLPQLLDVNGFEGIRIHSGNTEKDTEGCILVGTHRTKEGVANSRFACEILQNEIERAISRGEVVTIEIR